MIYKEIYKYEQNKRCSRATTKDLDSRSKGDRKVKNDDWSTMLSLRNSDQQ